MGSGSGAATRLRARHGSRRKAKSSRNIENKPSGRSDGGESSEIDLEAIVGEADIWGEGGVAFCMECVVSEVGEPGTLGFDVLGDFDGLGDCQVGGVRFFAEGVDNEDRNIANEIADGWGDGGAVGKVGGARAACGVDSESSGGNAAVGDGEGNESDGTDGERAGDGVWFGADVGGATCFEIECVVEGFFEPGESEGIGVKGNTVSIFE